LKNEIEFNHEAHLLDGIILPQLAKVLEQLQLLHLVDSDADGKDIEGQHVPGIVELAVLGLGEVQSLVELVQDVLLDDGVGDDPTERVETNRTQILPPEGIVNGVHLAIYLVRHVVLCSDEDLCQGLRRLEHETEHDEHAGARHDVAMVLDDELLTEDGRALPLLRRSATHRHRSSSLQPVHRPLSLVKRWDLNISDYM